MGRAYTEIAVWLLTIRSRVVSRVSRVPGIARAYLSSLRGAARHRKAFDGVEVFCLFVGHPRSGHSLVGSLLDAHAQIVIAHELDALRYVRLRFRRHQLYSLILERSREFTAAGRRWTGYEYAVRGQWQGRYEELKVIGDKKGGASSRWLRADPTLLERLRKTVAVRLAVIHIVRNPFDNIGTMSRRTGATLDYSIRRYFALCDGIQAAKQAVAPQDLLELRYEELVASPKMELGRLCRFLGVKADREYMDACCEIIFPSPRKSRRCVDWPDAEREAVERGMEAFDFLTGYRFDS